MRTFFLSPDSWQGSLQLEGTEAHHLLKVVRVRTGERVRLLNGQGREAICTVGRCTRNNVELILEEDKTHPLPPSRAILAVGWGKAVRRSWLLEKAVELEASGIWLWQADRSQTPVPNDIRDSWQSQMIAGAKQSNNPWLPELKTFTGGAQEMLEDIASCDRSFLLWEGDIPEKQLETQDVGQQGTSVYIIGPEGGFSEREVQLFMQHSVQPVSLGQRVLRWETAAMLTLGLHWWNAQHLSH